MQENSINGLSAEDEAREFKEYKQRRREEEAKANVAKIECDCLSPYCDKVVLRENCKSANGIALGGVIVLPAYVKSCVAFLGKDPKTSLIAAISYPHGLDTTEIKVAAVKRAVKDGVDEVEVYAPLSMIKDGNHAYFKRECKKIKKAAKTRAARMVFDCSLITFAELVRACSTAADNGISCIRLNNAEGETVSKIKQAVKGKCLIKADGAESLSAFGNYCIMGADYVSSRSACELATLILRQTD